MSMRVIVVAVLALAAGCKGNKSNNEMQKPAEGACLADGDCVISCETKDNCCQAPYCETVKLRAEAIEAENYNAKNCNDEKRKQCPDVGGIPQPDYAISPRCVSGKCVAQKMARKAKLPSDPANGSGSGGDSGSGGASPGSSSGAASAPPVAPGSLVVDATAFDRSCKVKADCKIVKADPCDHCSCADKAIAAKEAARFEKAADSIKCPAPDKNRKVCGECRGFLPACENSTCVAKPE